MSTGYDALTVKEKEALRLLMRGHDAKSSARELGLSVHTINERLRDARRKLGVTSSREAARLLMAAETLDTSPEMLGAKPLGDAAAHNQVAGISASATRRRAGPRPAVILVGVTAMSLVLAALFIPASPLSVMAPATIIETVSGAEPAATLTETEASARAAERFLALIDEGRWADSYAATSADFRRLNTLTVWSEVSARVRPPLGQMLTRDIVGNEYVPAPPAGYRLVKFRSAYASGITQTESVSLAWEDGAWKVAGVTFD